MKKAIGIILSVVCLLATATSILGIITANQGRVESISPDQLSELYAISEMPFPDGPEDGAASETEHPRSDTFVQLVKKMTDTTLTGRMRVLEGLTKKYESMEAELVKGGMKEVGKTPSRAVGMHQKIYDAHPDVNAILLAHPVHAMAFAVTDAKFDARTIPESYIQLRNVQKLPYEEIYNNQDGIVSHITPTHPAAIVENDCVIVTGSSLLGAFDRLEVMESTANSILNSRELGDVVHISDQEIADLKKAFDFED